MRRGSHDRKVFVLPNPPALLKTKNQVFYSTSFEKERATGVSHHKPPERGGRKQAGGRGEGDDHVRADGGRGEGGDRVRAAGGPVSGGRGDRRRKRGVGDADEGTSARFSLCFVLSCKSELVRTQAMSASSFRDLREE
eukprot:760334-Hanusia_phi.AAC.4